MGGGRNVRVGNTWLEGTNRRHAISEARNEASAIWSEFNGRPDGWILQGAVARL
jgi:hypothetical protein